MNKIFNINLGGYPFTIDEDAYEHLNVYLETIHRHFRQSEGYEEITEDIEARLAELFQEKRGNRPIVNIKDVKDAILTMGTPEEFGADPLGADDEGKSSTAQRQYKTGKRLFRNPEEEVIGGVCSGVAAYFGIQDPLWVRILFIVLTISGGFGIPLYAILWAVLPKAESASDRLAMRGQPINVDNIGKVIEDEFKNFSDKMSELGDEISSKKKSFSTENGSKVRSALAKGVHFLGLVLRKLIGAFGQIWKPIIILIGFALIIAFAVSWIVSIIGLFYSFPFLEYLNPDNSFFSIVAPINLLFLIGIPLIGLGLFVARLAFGTRVQAKWRGSMLAFWIINFIGLCFWGSMIARDFSAGSEVSDRFYLQELNTDTISLLQADDPYEYVWYSLGDELKYTGDELIGRDVTIRLEKSETDQFELIKQIHSRGGTVNDANSLAREVRYPLSQEGDRLEVSPAIVFPKGSKWRNQRVVLKLSIPEGKFIRLDKNLIWKIRHMDLAEGHKRVYAENTLWRMQEDGLACLNCPPQENEKEFDYQSFNELKVDGKIRVNIEQVEEYSHNQKVSLQGKERFLEKIDVVWVDQTLIVSTDEKHFSSPVYLNIKVPSLKALTLENTIETKIMGLTAPYLELIVKGESQVKAYVNVDSLLLHQQGRNKIDLRGRTGWMDASLSDHARLDAEKTEIETAKIDAKQYSNILLPKIESLEQKMEENSKIVVNGEEKKSE